ncbi:hypothetical protein POM88_006234 [Heracleum sosnowskyi]|uniref:Uncharacterized protein n=1 Tax=Heracleum sosnowskyi TaxID=360622 RepID=A0AAD8J534_9APIA|nr:hypothetical protein POM88_006234 [Heracleum sosnowskyi]
MNEKSKDSNADGFNFLEIDKIEVNNNLAIVPQNGKKNPGCFRLESPDRPESEVVYSDDEIYSLHVRFIGVSKLVARFCEKEGITKDISRLWCEWLGKNDLQNEDILIPDSDFAVVTFPYDYDLGRKALFTDVQHFLLPSSQQVNGRATKRKRKSFSDQEDISESLGSNQYDSSGEENLSSNGSTFGQTLVNWICGADPLQSSLSISALAGCGSPQLLTDAAALAEIRVDRKKLKRKAKQIDEMRGVGMMIRPW